MKKLYFLLLSVLVVHAHQSMPSDSQDPVPGLENMQSADTVDVRALDELILGADFPEPDLEQLHIPAWKVWLIKAGDTMFWTMQTGKDAVMAAYDRCKRLINLADDHDEIGS